MGFCKTVSRDLVAGIGFRRAAGADEIVALVCGALVVAEASPDRLAALATAEDRADEPAFREAAAALGCEAIGLSPAALSAVDTRVPTRSARIEQLRGVGSLAEASALAGAGEGGTLLVPRIASARVTCALACRAPGL